MRGAKHLPRPKRTPATPAKCNLCYARKTIRSGTPPTCPKAASRGGVEAPRGGGGVRPHAATKCAVHAARVRGRGVEERDGGSPWGAAAPTPPTPSHGGALSRGGLAFCVTDAGGRPSHNGGRAHAPGGDAEYPADARPPRRGRQRAPLCTHGAPHPPRGAPQGLHPAWLLRAVRRAERIVHVVCWNSSRQSLPIAHYFAKILLVRVGNCAQFLQVFAKKSAFLCKNICIYQIFIVSLQRVWE